MSCVYVFRLVISYLNKAHTKNGEKIVYRCNKQSSEITSNTAKPLVKGLKQLNKNRYNCLIYRYHSTYMDHLIARKRIRTGTSRDWNYVNHGKGMVPISEYAIQINS